MSNELQPDKERSEFNDNNEYGYGEVGRKNFVGKIINASDLEVEDVVVVTRENKKSFSAIVSYIDGPDMLGVNRGGIIEFIHPESETSLRLELPMEGTEEAIRAGILLREEETQRILSEKLRPLQELLESYRKPLSFKEWVRRFFESL